MKVSYTKAHGARNDFLLTWAHTVPPGDSREIARAICDRHTGVGADGWMLVSQPANGGEDHGSIRLYNSDGSDSEISGNGTRCAAAFLLDAGLSGEVVLIRTGAGVKRLKLLKQNGLTFLFDMGMGIPRVLESAHLDLPSGPREGLELDVGNPQFALMVNDFDFDWRAVGKEIEWHSRFPRRTNVSFVRRVDEHTLDVRFFERGAGETMSSGTGSTGAVAAALHLGLVRTPVKVLTPAGPLDLRNESGEIFLTGPAQIVAGGEFYL